MLTTHLPLTYVICILRLATTQLSDFLDKGLRLARLSGFVYLRLLLLLANTFASGIRPYIFSRWSFCYLPLYGCYGNQKVLILRQCIFLSLYCSSE